MQTFGIDITVTPYDWILDLLGVESVIGVGKTGQTTVSYSTSLRLIGDAGSKALISGYSTVGGYYNHQVDSWPASGDARSSVSGLAGVFGSGQAVQTHRNHDGYHHYSDAAIEPLAADRWDIAPFEMVVGDILNLAGYFTVTSFAEINDVCGFLGCVPGLGLLSISQTTGEFSVRLDIQEVNPVQEPPGALTIATGLLLLAIAFRSRAHDRGI
jgi:hypothetical protein